MVNNLRNLEKMKDGKSFFLKVGILCSQGRQKNLYLNRNFSLTFHYEVFQT